MKSIQFVNSQTSCINTNLIQINVICIMNKVILADIENVWHLKVQKWPQYFLFSMQNGTYTDNYTDNYTTFK